MNNSKSGWLIFDKVYCLTQESRPDRWEQAKAEFDRVGIKAERFLSIPADQPNQSFCYSQYAMLKTFLAGEGDTLLTFEDDVIFYDVDEVWKALADLPIGWDIVYLGANITEGVFGIKEMPPTRSERSYRLYRVRKAWTTHAIGYTRKMAQEIVNRYPVQTFEMYDNWLNSEILPHYNCYLVNPMVAFQRPGKSDLWGGIQTDYTGAFEWGNKFMSK